MSRLPYSPPSQSAGVTSPIYTGGTVTANQVIVNESTKSFWMQEVAATYIHFLDLGVNELTVEEAEVKAYDELWDKAFADSQDFLVRMADEVQALYDAGLTEDFDPDIDIDL